MIKTREGKNRIFFIFLGAAAIAGWFVFSPLGVIVFAIFGLSVYLINKYGPQDSKVFLVRLLIAGFAIRIILAVLNYFIGLTGAYHGCDTQADAIVYNGNAFYLAYAMRGLDISKDLFKEPYLTRALIQRTALYAGHVPPVGEYQFGAYVKFIGFLYAYLGYAPIAAKYINCLAGSLGAILVFFISKKITGSEISSRVSAFIVMFFPSMVYWSVTLLQDALVNLLMLICLFALTIYIDRVNMLSFAIAGISCGLLVVLKIKMGPLLCVVFVIYAAVRIARIIASKSGIVKALAILCLAAILAVSATVVRPEIVKVARLGLHHILNIHRNTVMTHTSASTYKLYDENVYDSYPNIDIAYPIDAGLGRAALKALAYYFLSPLPWDAAYKKQLLMVFYPQVIFTLIAIPFSLVGVIVALKRDLAVVSAIVLALVLLILPQAMAEGIVGNVVRHRDMFMPFVIIFASFGFCETFLRRKDI